MMAYDILREIDPEVASTIDDEIARQQHSIELIASENIMHPAIIEAMGSVLANKYAEGLPGHRYYGGCQNVDRVESLAIERVCKLYDCRFANVQPHSGAQANEAAYLALVKPGDTVLGMSLAHGGHLTHGSPANFSGKLYDAKSYGVDPVTERIDMDEVERIAKETRPKLIVAGASAYPRIIDFERFAEIAHEVGAYLLVDMAHIAGLVAGGAHPSPIPYADVVSSTSHKSLRGARGGFLLTNSEDLIKRLNSAVFPGVQGGPLENIIAGKAVTFGLALKPGFTDYAHAIVRNAKALGEGFASGGFRLVSGGTDNHLCLVDLTKSGVTGIEAENLLDSVGITANKNTIPNEKRSPFVASGLRVGTPTITARGFDEDESRLVGELAAFALMHNDDRKALDDVHQKVEGLLARHPIYTEFTE